MPPDESWFQPEPQGPDTDESEVAALLALLHESSQVFAALPACLKLSRACVSAAASCCAVVVCGWPGAPEVCVELGRR